MKLKSLIKEENESSFNYHKSEISRFISQSDTSSPYKPQIKLHWGGDNGEANTKWLSIGWQQIDELLKILEKNK